MAKFNPKKKTKKHNGYFEQQVQKMGPDFIEQMNAQNIQRDSSRIFRDMAYCPAEEMDKYEGNFENHTFTYNLALVAYQKYSFYNACCIGLNQYLQIIAANGQQPDPSQRLDEQFNIAKNKAEAYALINGYLNNIITVLTQVSDKTTRYVAICNNLRALSNALTRYKYTLD